MKDITIEMVDQVLERLPYISYKEAKEALIKTDGDVLDAIILIEDEEKIFKNVNVDDIEEKFTESSEKLRNQVACFLKKTNEVRVVIEKEDRTLLNIPLVIGVVGVTFMPIASLLGVSAAVLSKYSVKILDENTNEGIDMGKLTPEKLEILKDMFMNSIDNVKGAIKKKDKTEEEKNDDFSIDITEELLNEQDENKNDDKKEDDKKEESSEK